MPTQQHAQHERRKGIGSDQPRHFRPQKSITPAVTKHQQQFGNGQLQQNDTKDEKDARAS